MAAEGGEVNLPSAKSLHAGECSDSGLMLEASSADKFEMTLHRDAKFWDAIANRKMKAKKRKARKFLSHQQERFSIGEDLNAMEEEGATEVNFYSSFTAGASAAPQTAEAGNFSSMSDMDLIMQLAELEGSGAGNSASQSTLPTKSATEDKKEDIVKTAAASSELQVLAELERELGLDNFLTGVPSTTDASTASATASSATVTKSAPPAAAVLDDDENLDELEKYLQSLGK